MNLRVTTEKKSYCLGKWSRSGAVGTDQRRYKRRAPGEGWREIVDMKDLHLMYFEGEDCSRVSVLAHGLVRWHDDGRNLKVKYNKHIILS